MNLNRIHEKQNSENKINDIDPDVIRLLSILDELFAKLPKKVIDELADSKYFQIYKKVMEKYNIGIS